MEDRSFASPAAGVCAVAHVAPLAGRGACCNNGFVQRLWRRVKTERVQRRACAGLNWRLSDGTPDEHCFANLPDSAMAA